MPITCVDAIKEVVTELDRVASIKEIIDRIYDKYPDKPWKKSTIRAHIIGCSVNHSSSHHYPSLPKFLYTVGRGLVKIYDSEIPTKPAKMDIDDEEILSFVKREIRQMKLFLNGDISKNDFVLCYWVWLCYNISLYDIGAKIYQRIDGKKIPVELYKITQKIAEACDRKVWCTFK